MPVLPRFSEYTAVGLNAHGGRTDALTDPKASYRRNPLKVNVKESGAPGEMRFELPTLWFEARLLTFRKRLIFNHAIENLGLSSSGRMFPGVRVCGCLHVGVTTNVITDLED
jgi:hypothetical protein